MLTKEAILEFQKIYEQKVDPMPNLEEARLAAEDFLTLFDLLSKSKLINYQREEYDKGK